MDQTDRRIIDLLRENGRRSNVEIARELGVSEGTIRKRVDRLLSSHILKIVGLVDVALAGFDTRALIYVSVELPQAEEAGRRICDFSEVVRVYWVTGEYDFVVDAVFESDRQLMSFLTEKLSIVPGVIKTQTAHVLHLEKRSFEWTIPCPPPPSILLVDDDPDFVETTRLVLASEDYVIRSASSGEQALKQMEADPPDLVVLDVMMDGVLDGWDASWRIRSNPKLHDTPILVVSSITASDYLSMFPTDEDNLVDNFLSKPVHPKKLLAEVRRLLARR